MKRLLSVTLIALVLALSLFIIACNQDSDIESGGDMLYTADTSLGSGATTFTLVCEHIDGTKINFTISTSKEILSDALTELGILQGHDSTYGLYIDAVNGVTHDYDSDQTYWAIYEGDSYASTGIDGITVSSGAVYKLVASK